MNKCYTSCKPAHPAPQETPAAAATASPLPTATPSSDGPLPSPEPFTPAERQRRISAEQGDLRPDPVKVKAVVNFSRIALPLTQLTSPKIDFQWSDATQSAFQELKKRFASAPILVQPDTTLQFVVEGDASDSGVGAITKTWPTSNRRSVSTLDRPGGLCFSLVSTSRSPTDPVPGTSNLTPSPVSSPLLKKRRIRTPSCRQPVLSEPSPGRLRQLSGRPKNPNRIREGAHPKALCSSLRQIPGSAVGPHSPRPHACLPLTSSTCMGSRKTLCPTEGLSSLHGSGRSSATPCELTLTLQQHN
ncbi:zinc finger protein GLIS1/3 [Sarotherodon galilaeus]